MIDVSLTIAATVLEALKRRNVPLDKALKAAVDELSVGVASGRLALPPSQDEVRESLRKAHASGKQVLVLGAGVSLDYGLPSWNTLLQALFARTFHGTEDDHETSMVFAEVFTSTFEPSPLIAARYLAGQFGAGSLAFEKAVRDLLYKQLQDASTSGLMREIVQLAPAPGRAPNLDSVITYNFDDILETELSKPPLEVSYRSIFSVGQNPQEHELPIYHVHGYIPRTGRLTKENQITLGEDLYHQQYTNVYSWSNLVQLNKFKSNYCVFIGVSLTDPNQRRLLDIAATQRGNQSPRHFIVRRRHPKTAIESRLNRFLDANSQLVDKKVLHNIKFSDLVDKMIETVHRFEEHDALSLGIQTIWVDEFAHMPDVLKRMRTAG